jgi:RNA polymerase sigma factor (sigma-70 family)
VTATDRALLERWIARRDGEAFNEIVSRHADMVFGVSRRLLRNDADAEDITQGCFLKLARSPSPPRSSVLGWLHAAATNAAIDLRRAGARRRERERVFAERRAREHDPGLSHDPAGASQDLAELHAHVDECMLELPEELRTVIAAHFLERRTQETLAADLGVSRQTVGHRIRRGIDHLRRLLAKRGVSISVAALASGLARSSLDAAPPALLASLGRLALAGPSIAPAAGPAAALSLTAKIGGLLMAKKLLISGTVAAVLLVLAGYAAYRTVVQPAIRSSPSARVSRSAGTGAPPPTLETRVAPGVKAQRAAAAADGGGDAIAALPRVSLEGTVADPEGRPVEGARVVAAGPAEDPKELAAAESDAAGRFRLEAPEGTDAAVYAFKPGAGLGQATGEPGALAITLEPLGELGGRFYDRDTGEGIAGLTVRLARYSSPAAAPEVAALHAAAWRLFEGLHGENGGAVTDDDGRYAFREVSPLRYRFELDPDSSDHVLPGYRLDDSTPEILLAPGERRSGVDFALQRGGSIAGTVFGPDGRSLAGARVEALPSYHAPLRRVARCGPDGTYRFRGLAPNATYVIWASHEGLAPGESPVTSMPAAQPVEGVDVHLARGHSLRGRFIDDLGQPVAGIGVMLRKASGTDRRSQGHGGAATGEDGSFSFERVAPGEYVLLPHSSVHVTDAVFPFTMPEGRDLTGLELVLRRKAGGFVSGHVVDHVGTPVAGFPVSAMRGSKAVARAVTGEDGAFHLEGLGDAETCTVTGYTEEYWSGRQPEVAVNSTGITLVVYRRGRIAGRVVDAETRRPIENFEVRAAFIRTEPGGAENRFHLKWTPFDSVSGEFHFERAEPVDCEVQARAEGYIEGKSARFSIPPGEAVEDVVIALRRGESLRGTVVSAESGEPLAGALVRTHQHDDFFPGLLEEARASYAPRGVWKLAMSGEDGSFAFGGLTPGETVHLIAWKDGYGPTVLPGVAVGSGDPSRISLARAATIAIAATFRHSAVARYEFHAYHREEKPWRAAFRSFAAAERPGTVEMPGLPPGAYRLAVWSAGREGGDRDRRLIGEARIEVPAGERLEVPIDVEDLAGRFSSVSGKVIGGGGAAGIRLGIISAGDPEEPYTAGPTAPDGAGRFRFGGLPAGKYIVLAGREGTPPPGAVRVPVQVGDREHAEVEVALE